MQKIQRGEIYLAALSGYVGSEQSGTRPVIVIQNDLGNMFSPTTVIVPLTSKQKPFLPTHTSILRHDSGINEDSIVLCEQIRVIDKSRLITQIGKVENPKIINELDHCLMISIGVLNDKNEKDDE